MNKLYRMGMLLAMIGFILMPFSAQATAEEVETIKVGYVLNCGMVQSPVADGAQGYLHEYMNTVVTYMNAMNPDGNYEMEYVACELDEAYALLEDGTIDVFGPIGYNQAMDGAYGFSEYNVGSAVLYLSTLSGKSIFFDNYAKLNGETIAVRAGDVNVSYLHDFIAQYGLDCEILEVSEDTFEIDMANGLYSYCMSNSMESHADLKSVAYLGTSEMFLVATEEQGALLEQLDDAMQLLAASDYLYQEQLYLKYFEDSLNENIYITQQEYDILQEKSTYYIGYTASYYPLVYIDEEGEVAGVAIELMEMLADEGNFDIEFLDVDDPNTDRSLIDISIAAGADYNEVERYPESEPYLNLPFIMLENNEYNSESSSIGILGYYGMDEASISAYKFGSTTTLYEDMESMVADFNDGDIEGIILTSIGLNQVVGLLGDVNYTITPLEVELGVTLIFPNGLSDEEVKIFNKLIAKVDRMEMEVILSEHLSREEQKSFLDLIYNYKTELMIVLFVGIMIIGCLDGRQRRKVRHMIQHDELTNLMTTYKFSEEARKLLKHTPKTRYSIMSIDIDNFKYINELYGYEVGTKILKTFGCFVGAKVYPKFPMARCFADNFLILVHSDMLKEKVSNSLKLNNEIYGILQDILGENYNFSFSIGIYDIKEPTLDFSYMVDCANLARIEGKAKTGNTVVRFNDAMSRERTINKEIITNMNAALKNREFIMYYQNKNDLETGEIVGSEALVRWITDDKMKSPAEFIPIFEKNGFIEKLDYYVLGEVCEFIEKHRHENIPRISVNLSGITITHKNVVDKITKTVSRYGVSPTELDLEITESAFTDDSPQLLQKVTQLQQLGFTISMDDFGAGISSLNRLKELPIDILKIDRAFIVGTIENEKGIVILKNIIRMAKELHIETVAEGIETTKQLELLQELGCDVGQGYYFARPCPEDKFMSQYIAEKKGY